jgi:hypothetical protein
MCRARAILVALAVVAARSVAQTTAVPAAPQNPSPMAEKTRAHARLPETDAPGVRRTFTGPLDKPVQVFVPLGAERARSPDLVIHFHGAAFVPETAVSRLGRDHVVATVNLAPGSGVFGDVARVQPVEQQHRIDGGEVTGVPTAPSSRKAARSTPRTSRFRPLRPGSDSR